MLPTDNEIQYNCIFFSVDASTTSVNEPKFIVFYHSLFTLFSLFCFNCKAEKPEVIMEQNGTMVTVEQQCTSCHAKPFRWRSQPFMLGRYPAGNILLSFATLMAGASISKVLLVFRHFGLAAYSSRTFFIINANIFCQASFNTGSHTKLSWYSHWSLFKIVFGVDMVDSTPWVTLQNMEFTQCSVVP